MKVFLGESGALLGALSAAFGDDVEVVERRALAEIVCFTMEEARTLPMDVGAVLNVLDVRGAAKGSVPFGTGLLLVGSEAEFGAWSDAGLPMAVVPVVVESGDVAGWPGACRALHIVADLEAVETVRVAAAWAKRRGIACGIAAAGPSGLALVAEFGAAPVVAPGSVMVELRGVAAQLRGAQAVLLGMAAGAPVVFGVASPFATAVAHAGAGVVLDDIEAGLEAIAPAMAAAAVDFVRARHGVAAARAGLRAALPRALARMRRHAEAWARRGPGGHVLVISDEALNLRDIRVHLPFDAMVRRGAISGYSVLRHGEFVFTTVPVSPSLRFAAVWVQRSVDPLVWLLLQALGRPFVYDLDDHLLVSPAYRPAFPPEAVETARGLIRGCAVLSCATAALAGALADEAAGKTIVTPNLVDGPAERVAGPMRSVVWASSDHPALTRSGAEIVRAVRDFSLAHGVAVLCIGAAPPAGLVEAGVTVEHVGLLSYAAYLARLRAAAPGVLVAPLEVGADAATQAFVDAKSDIKVIEARRAGLVGVFSRAAPYVASDLAPSVLCENSYGAWLEGLERARLLCLTPAAVAGWPDRRSVDATGPMPWAEAVRRGRTEVSAAEVLNAVHYVRAQGETLLTSPERFDEADYLRRHDDVRDAVEAGVVASGYRHYVQNGFREGRLARRRPAVGDARELWWTRLLRTVDAAEASVARRTMEIEGLRSRVVLGGSLRMPGGSAGGSTLTQPPPVSGRGLLAGGDGVRWWPGDALPEACPVCDAAGPHAVLLATEGQRLGRCGACGSCFYAERSAHRYEESAETELLLRFSLEQNAGVYHQTRLLFAVEGVDSVLDVGCGFGFAVAAAAGLGWRAVGIDPSFYAAAGAAQLEGTDIRQAYLTEATALGETFGLVLASEVVEHVEDPAAFLLLLRRALAPGGTLVLTTPDAGALAPGLDRSSLFGILALRVHLILFSQDGLSLALQRAGFRHVRVERENDGLIAYASDAPLRFARDRAARHLAGYRALLERLLERAAPGSALWNGAAGRLFALLGPSETPAWRQALWGRIASVWRERFGFDLAAGELPAPGLSDRQPINLAGVLLQRALMETDAETVLAWARKALAHATSTSRALLAKNLVDLDLERIAGEARALIAGCLTELVPEVAGEVLLGLAAGREDRAVARRIATGFSEHVQADRFEAALVLTPWMHDLERLGRLLDDDPPLLLRALFSVGVQALIGAGDAERAMAAFTRLALEAERWLDAPEYRAVARDFLRVAREHQALASSRVG